LYRLDDVHIAPAADVQALRTARTRRLARWNAFVRGGRPAGRAIRHLQRAQADLGSHLVVVRADPSNASFEYPGINESLATVNASRTSLEALGIPESDNVRAKATWSGWLSVVGGIATLFAPYAVLVPVLVTAWRVRDARQGRVRADPLLLTGLLIGVSLFLVWLALRAVSSVRIV